MFFVFARLIALQSKKQDSLNYKQNLKEVLQNELDHFKTGQNFYTNGDAFANRNHPYTDDLDIFGAGSLYQFLNRCKTNAGNRFLAAWLQNAAKKSEIEQRQEAVTELVNHADETFDFRSKLIKLKGDEPDQLTAAIQNNLGAKLVFTQKKLLHQYVAVAPYLIAALVIGAVFSSIILKILGLWLLFHFFLSGIFGKQANLVYAGFSRSGRQLTAFASVLKWIEETNWQSSFLKALATRSSSGTAQKAHLQIAALAKIMKQFDYRLNMIVGTVLNLLMLWDLRCCMALAGWQKSAANNVTDSFEVIAQFEAAVSIATLHYNHPDWPFPVINNNFGD